MSDAVSLRDWRRSPIYNEIDRPMGVEHVMRLWIDPSDRRDVRLEFDRSDPDDDFHDSDVARTRSSAPDRRPMLDECARRLLPRASP